MVQLSDACPSIIESIEQLTHDNSVAIRKRAAKALGILIDAGQPCPKGWIKSDHLADI